MDGHTAVWEARLAGQWLIVPGHEDQIEVLGRRGIPAVWMQAGEPPVSGVAFPAEHVRAALALLGLTPEAWRAVPASVDGCALLVPSGLQGADDPDRSGYVGLCTLRLGRELKEAERALHAAEEQAAKLMQDLARVQGDAASAREKLIHFQRYTRGREAYWAGEFDRLRNHPHVAGVEVFEGGLRVRTTAIHIAVESRRYLIGRFEMELYVGGRVLLHNVARVGADGCDHPHVKKGSPCLGNIAGPVAKLIGEFEFVTAAFLLLEFLESYNPENAYCSVSHWKEVS